MIERNDNVILRVFRAATRLRGFAVVLLLCAVFVHNVALAAHNADWDSHAVGAYCDDALHHGGLDHGGAVSAAPVIASGAPVFRALSTQIQFIASRFSPLGARAPPATI